MHWILVNIVPKLISAACYSFTGALVAIFVTAPLRAGLRAAQKHIKVMADSLDPDIPEGVTKQIDDLRRAVEHAPLAHDSDQHLPRPPAPR